GAFLFLWLCVEAGRSRRCLRHRRPRPWRLQVEHLEDRTVPSTLHVNTALDEVVPGDGMLSLREAINAANSGDKIVFDAALAGQTIALTEGELLIDKSLTILGLGADNLAVSGSNSFR